jgi:hypothetical protein
MFLNLQAVSRTGRFPEKSTGRQFFGLLNGELVASGDGRQLAVTNPAIGEVFAQCPELSLDQVCLLAVMSDTLRQRSLTANHGLWAQPELT